MTIFRAVLLLLSVMLTLDLAAAQVAKRVWRGWYKPMPANNFRSVSQTFHHGLRPMADELYNAASNTYRVATNSLGMVDADRRVVEPNARGCRIVFMGDSFTEGFGVGWEGSFVRILADKWKSDGIEVLNSGVGGYSPTIYYRRTRHLIEDERLKFDALFVTLDVTDVLDEVMNYDLDDKERVVQTTTHFSLPMRQPTFADRIALAVVDNSLTVRLLYGLISRTRFSPSFAGTDPSHFPPMDLSENREKTPLKWSIDDPSELLASLTVQGDVKIRHSDAFVAKNGYWMLDKSDWLEFGKLGLQIGAERMDRLVALLRKHGIPLTIGVHPWQTILLAGEKEPVNLKFWRSWAQRRGVGFVDHFPSFFNLMPMVVESHFLEGDFHWNARGHALVADTISRAYNPRAHCKAN